MAKKFKDASDDQNQKYKTMMVEMMRLLEDKGFQPADGYIIFTSLAAVIGHTGGYSLAQHQDYTEACFNRCGDAQAAMLSDLFGIVPGTKVAGSA